MSSSCAGISHRPRIFPQLQGMLVTELSCWRGSACRQEHQQVCQDQTKPDEGDADCGALKASVFPFMES